MPRKKSEIEISLTDFVDFVCKSGGTKLTLVKNIKGRDDYSPATDFYRGLREGIVNNHQIGGDKLGLKKIIDSTADLKKIKNYTEAIDGYKKFWGKKSMKWFVPTVKHWTIGNLGIKINPELGLEYDGKLLLIKLYFKSERLSKDRINQILTLMETQLRKGLDAEIRVAVLDVKNAKIFIKEDDDISLFPLLEGEAISFETIWKGIK